MSERRVYAVGSGTTWDHRRNTSEVRPGGGFARDAVRAIRRWAEDNPAHADWIEDGYPTMTEDEHVRRFGVPYERAKRRRAS